MISPGRRDDLTTALLMPLRAAIRWLLVLVLALPVVQAVLVWVGALLRGMDDAEGAAILARVGLACQVVWTLGLVGLVIVLALVVLSERPPNDQPRE